MRHENLEHHRNRVEPFEVVGPAKFIAASLGWSHDYLATALEDHLVSGQGVEVMVGDKRKPAVIVAWEMSGCMGQDAAFKVKFHSLRPVQAAPASPAPDPWIKVGTTTIDGDVSGLWESDDLDEMRGRVRFIGGRHLRLEWWETSRGVDIAFCDIVRRQSEIDDEHLRAQMNEMAEHKDMVSKAFAKPCPECGPHGNRGEVLLASSWARCTTCAGGKPGDLWGEVKDEAPSTTAVALSPALTTDGTSSEVARAGVLAFMDALNSPMSFMDARREALAAHCGFKVPTFLEMRGAALDDLRRRLESNAITYDDSSIARASQVIEESLAAYRSWLSTPISVTITES